ncbi:ABC transporter permease [Bosea sp. (in: a-proteobacteria)]|uniref:ABC transporter permease n=1 Tax=Bosea sp. (in: a-proteobacteria) TaxID=1871050 RepID=UPI00261BFBAD|nr:ABC transporter permease [Bosea sp. (in: a-proteobacteria)]MCO5090652.1 ABC transporter permease [Bosea sp. (in: a-proteobacteria)]
MSSTTDFQSGGGIKGPLQLVALCLRRGELLREMTKRELQAGHAGHGLGGKWIYIHPLVVVGSYLLILGFVLGSRIAVSGSFPGDYPSYILVGLVPWLVTQSVLIRGAGALLGQAGLVKQVVFPIEIIPTAITVSIFLTFLPAFSLVLVYKLFLGGGIPSTIILLPFVLVIHFTLVLGLGFLLAAITVFMRDVKELVNVFCVVAMYFTPAIYLPDWVPKLLRPLIYMNPFSYITWIYQDTLFFGEIRHPFAWGVSTVMAIAAIYGGTAIFRRLKPYYGNVL